ncbi:hypothetical protein IQ250_27490, partial [Pseudanabaenaceae cyanobacterium LEGE 13415]|nr:hypothetical protein [Pseudanabaenaceae cyanobacterium LEGE 13415]
FAGLQSGEIQVWDVNQGKLEYTLKDPSDRAGDLFSLAFTRDSRYLYSGYGSGLVQVWESTSNGQFNPTPTTLRLNDPVLAQIHTLAISQDSSRLVTGGQFKRLVIWDLSRSPTSPTPRIVQNISRSRGTNDFFWNVTFMHNQPILATADSDGYITLWDLSQCQGTTELQCSIRDSWQASTSAIRSVQITSDDRRLISAGDDGRIVVWNLTPDQKRDQTQKEHIIATLPRRIISLNLTQNDQLIISGGEDSQVRLHSLN